LSLLLVAVAFSTFAAAGTISYSETFQTTGGQATTSGSTFDDYPDWTYEESTAEDSSAKVDAVGTLRLSVDGSNNGIRLKAYVTAQNLISQSGFDVSVNPLTVSASIAGDGVVGSSSPGLLIGSLNLMFFPGYTDTGTGTGIADVRMGGSILQRAHLGFVPSVGARYNVSMTILEDSTHTYYDLNYSIGSYNGTYQAAKADVGSLGKVGCYMEGGGGDNGYYSNFTVSQVPEPSTTVLVGIGIAGLLCYAWRKRR
jgi:hypothetical protein